MRNKLGRASLHPFHSTVPPLNLDSRDSHTGTTCMYPVSRNRKHENHMRSEPGIREELLERSMEGSIEYRTLLECFKDLVTALSLNPLSIADELTSRGLIPPTQPGDRRTSQEQARELACRIRDIVSITPKRYDDVVDILSKHQWLEDFVTLVRSTYGKLH